MTQNNIDFHQLIDGMRRELDSNKRLTLESFIMPEQSSGAESPERPAAPSDPAPQQKPQMTPRSSAASAHLAQIRRTAIEGIRDLADDPTDPSYELLKKIWNMCDKAMDSSNQRVGSEE